LARMSKMVACWQVCSRMMEARSEADAAIRAMGLDIRSGAHPYPPLLIVSLIVIVIIPIGQQPWTLGVSARGRHDLFRVSRRGGNWLA
jgi:hypothetical protein